MASLVNICRATLFCSICAWQASVCFAEITYQLQPQDANDEGWTFNGGFITTDGTLGVIDATNFIDFSIGFRSPARQNTITPQNGNAVLVVTSSVIGPGRIGPVLALVATENHLTIPPVDGGQRRSFLDLYITTEPFGTESFPGAGVFFGRSSRNSDLSLGGSLIDDAIELPPLPFQTEPQPGFSSFAIPGNDSAFASVVSVPEPNGCAITCLLIFSFFTHRRRRCSNFR